jgi:predicted transcriptional regulator
MTQRQTSLQAHEIIQSDGTASNQRMVILKYIRCFPDGLTRQEISRNLGITINATCGRINELLKLHSLYEDGKRIDRYSRKENYIIKASRIIEVQDGTN